MRTKLLFIHPSWSHSLLAAVAMLVLARPAFAAEEFNLQTALAEAAKGDAKAAYSLARHYAKGLDGVAQDYAKAAQYMRQSAELGYAFAQNDLGAYYAKGWGVKKDFAEAARWYLKAAQNGDALGQYSIGTCYLVGRGVSTNAVEAVRWFKQSAAQNEPAAMMALGNIYLHGSGGIPVDCKEAVNWFQKALAQGHLEALSSLGVIYERGGAGVDQNIEQAVGCFREAAEKGDALGQMNLGRLYMEGTGVKFDLFEAYKWFYLASKNGNAIANHYLQVLEGNNILPSARLTQEQITEAIRQANALDKTIKQKARAARNDSAMSNSLGKP